MSTKQNKIKDSLQTVLNQLRSSERFLILRLLRISHFLPNGTFGNSTLDQYTLEQLIEEGAAHIIKQRGVELETIENLLPILQGLLTDDTAETAFDLLQEQPPALDAPTENSKISNQRECNTVKEIQSKKTEEKRSSIEAERILRENFTKLEKAPSYPLIKDSLLSKYWDMTGVRDPFLEELTFKQLLNIKIEYLLKKRSFTDSKITALVTAINNCLADKGSVSVDCTLTTNREEVTAPTVNLISPDFNSITWRTHSSCEAPIADALLAQFKLVWSASQDMEGEIPTLLRDLPKWLTAREYIIWWIDAAYSLDLAAKLLRSTVASLRKEYKVCVEAIYLNFAVTAPVLYAHWHGALSGAGVSYQSLISSHLEEGLSPDYQLVFFKGLLKALGACNVTAFGIKLPNYWTTNPHLLQLILEGLSKKAPLPKDKIKAELEKILPLFDFKDLKPILNKTGLIKNR
ncbi:MAG: hypothetical protein ACOX2O_07420 [Bdellovibrionota bacterium]|jgi:hypothetical protein